MQVDNLFLEQFLGKGKFGEVYKTFIKGAKKCYATKRYERDKIENTIYMKYLENEISILGRLKHPNIIKLYDLKKTKKHFYLVTEYCNGGELTKALEHYLIKYGKAFPEDLVQYFMRQIISAFKYIHNQGMMHRDIKLENILLNFNNENDKNSFNLYKAQIKIIDFGFACQIDESGLKYTAVGNPMNMDPLILKKFDENNPKARFLGYDQKADIWSLGAICYKMLIGRAVFDADDMANLIKVIESGKYKVPTYLSKEVVSFLNGMLQYNADARLDINQLANHKFIVNNVKDFHHIDLRQVSKKLDSTQRNIVIDVKKNRSIWAIFNEEDELMEINPGYLAPLNEANEYQQNSNNILRQRGGNINNNNIPNNYNNNQNNNYYGPILPQARQGIPGNPMNPNIRMPHMQIANGNQANLSNPCHEGDYSFRAEIYNYSQ
jgi:serine/threonine protein kinase